MMSLSMHLLLLLQILLTLTNINSTHAIKIFPGEYAYRRSLESDANDRLRRQLLGNNETETVDVPKVSTPDEHLVTELPLLDVSKFPTDHWAGLLPASADGDKYFFYWLLAPDLRDHPDMKENDIPLLIWLNGGPGCSSLLGLWLENGPFRLTQTNDEGWKIDISEYSWHKSPAYVLFVDQPVGTGLSFTASENYAANDEEINIDFYFFLNEFFDLHSDKFLDAAPQQNSEEQTNQQRVLNRPFFFSGESHAGQYIPSMMAYIHQQNNNENENENQPRIRMSLSGGAIGNGSIDYYYQAGYQEAAYGHGILGIGQMYALQEKERACHAAYDAGEACPDVCEEVWRDIADNAAGMDAPHMMSIYDVRKFETRGQHKEFPQGHIILEAYLGGWDIPHDQPDLGVLYTDILKALHASPSDSIAGQRWESCSGPPHSALDYDTGTTPQEIVDLLDAGIPMLFYNGVYDLACDHVGTEKALDALEWAHQSDYLLAKRYAWASPSDGNIAGYMKETANLLFLKVLNSGHMVPMDVPLPALDMIQTFMYHRSFKTFEQNIKARVAPVHSCPVCTSAADEIGNCPSCLACGMDNKGDDIPGRTEEVLTPSIGGTTKMEGPPWMFALLGTFVGVTCSCLVTRIRRGRLRFTQVDHMDSEGMEMRSLEIIS